MESGREDEAVPTGERRGESRQIAVLRVAKLTTERGEQLCRIRNLSSGGVMAEVQGAYWKGETVAIELKSGGQLPGSIVWVEGGRIGIAFAQPIDPQQILAADTSQTQRLIRVAITAGASLCMGSVFRRILVQDISLGGARIQLEEPECTGSKVVLTIDGLPSLIGTVRWHEQGHAGIAFDELLDLDMLGYWLASRM